MLSPEASVATRSIVIDAVRSVDIMVSSAAQDLDVKLVSPRRAHYAVGQNRPDFQSSISRYDGLGANYRAILATPDPGRWILEVASRRLGAPVEVAVNVILQSDIFAVLAASQTEYRVGSTAAISLAVFERNTRIKNAGITAVVLGPGNAPAAVFLRDDGVEGDLTAGDGVYVALIPLGAEGEYRVDIRARGLASTGEFERTSSVTWVALPIRASFTGAVADNPIADADGFIESIVVSPAIDVVEPGRYEVSARLRSASGKIIQRTAFEEFQRGPATATVSFRASDVRDALGEAGPYTIEKLFLERFDGDRSLLADECTDCGTTQAYPLETLRHSERTRIMMPVRVDPFDRDNNNYIDELHVTVDLDADFAGLYAYSATLVTPGDEDADRDEGTTTLLRGRNQLHFRFDASAVGRGGTDGSCKVALSLLGPASGAALDKSVPTQAFLASQFEGFIPDTIPPQVSGQVVPDLLWPPDRRMVEVDVSYGASDNKDISPNIALESIVVTEDGEPVSDAASDVEVSGHRVFLRAHRSGNNSDRLYTFTFSGRDRAGNVGRATANVRVPHDRGTAP